MTPPLTDAELDALETEAKRLVALLDVRWKGDLRWWADLEARIKAIAQYAPMKELSGCICQGNWRKIIKESEQDFGHVFSDRNGDCFVFVGVLHGDDDYYYAMRRTIDGRWLLLSCVSDIAGHGFKQVVEKDQADE